MKTANPGRPMHHVKQDWEKLYRAAVLESDPIKLRQRVMDAEAAILERFDRLAARPSNNGNNEKEQEALTRARYILSMLRRAEQGS